jgi:ectoine hydroxylase-related dioxygenase (phytanoyl-CoA dioxygenase family)
MRRRHRPEGSFAQVRGTVVVLPVRSAPVRVDHDVIVPQPAGDSEQPTMCPDPAPAARPATDIRRLRAELRTEGAVTVPAVLDASWCARLIEAIERCRRTPSVHYGILSPPGSPRVDSDLFRWCDDPDLRALTHDSPLVQLAADLLDERDVVLVEDQWFSSEPGSSTPSPWHQDQPYYRVDRPFLTIWVTLDDIGDAGSLRVVPGSHDGQVYAPVPFVASGGSEDASPLPPPPAVDESSATVRSWDLRAGDAVALDSRVLHATGCGVLPAAFRRVSTRWASPTTRYIERGPGTAAFWDLVDHGRQDGDLLACDAFPLIPSTRSTT